MKRFIGRYLTEPKPQVRVTPPAALPPRDFAARAARRGVRLDLGTQLLYDARHVYINGSEVPAPVQAHAALARLADTRALEASMLRRAPARLISLLHDWYRHGDLEFDD